MTLPVETIMVRDRDILPLEAAMGYLVVRADEHGRAGRVAYALCDCEPAALAEARHLAQRLGGRFMVYRLAAVIEPAPTPVVSAPPAPTTAGALLVEGGST